MVPIPINGDAILLVLHRRQGPDQPPGGIGHQAGVGRMQVALRTTAAQLQVLISLQAQVEGDPLLLILAARLPEAAIGLQQVSVSLGQLCQMRAASLLFALNEELQSQRQLAEDGQVGLHRLDAGHEVALVIGDAPDIDLAITDGGLERGRQPQIQRVGGLHIIMIVA